MSINQDNNEVELELADRTSLMNKYEALERLKQNPDFKVLILDGYLKERAVDQVSLLSTGHGRPVRSILFEELAAISCFEGYLHMVTQLGSSQLEDDVEDTE